jgi:hypothetical protein
MSTAEDDPDRKQETRASDSPASERETPTPLEQAGAEITEAQAWKGRQIATGWRKLVDVLRRHKED